jgi:hypothetical protein
MVCLQDAKGGNGLQTVHQLFIDFMKAYDSVRKEIVYNILWGTHETSQVD